jgi:hypothetical protein
MSPLEYLAGALSDWPQYLALALFFGVLHVVLIRRWVVGIYDPLFMLLLSNALGWAIVWFMFLRADITDRYVVSFTIAQLALYAGFAVARPRLGKRIEMSNTARQSRLDDQALPTLVLLVAAIVHIASTLWIWEIAGIPLFRESRLGAFEGSGGYGALERLVESSALIAIFAVVYLLVQRPRLRRNVLVHAFLVWFVAALALSGSKSALLIVGQYVLSILYVYTTLRHRKGRFWGGRTGKLLLVVSTVFAVGVLGTQTENDLASAALAFVYRVVSFGDVYIFAYPNATIESLKGDNPLVGLFGAFLSTFRLFPQDAVYPNLGYQFTTLVFPDLDIIVGPNPQHPVFGYHYFGPLGFVFSFVVGAITAWAQARFYHRTQHGFLGGLVAFLLYFTLVSISLDFEYTLSKLANVIIGMVVIVGPVLLALPHASILRLPRRRVEPPRLSQPT